MFAHKMYLLLTWICCVSESFQQPRGNRNSFWYESRDTRKFVSDSLKIRPCFYDATDKAKQIGQLNNDQFQAISWISMYSRLCLIDKTILTEDNHINNFPFRLNKELRCDFTVHSRNPQVRSIFRQVGVIIDKSLDVLKPSPYTTNLYRGLKDFPCADQNEFVDNGFFSATIDINVALHFAEGNILLIVERMYGVYIADYAEDRFRHQKEVLAKQNTMFRIRRKVTNAELIHTIITNLNLRITRPYPKEIVYIYQVVNPGTGVIRAVSDAQSKRTQTYDYCKPS